MKAQTRGATGCDCHMAFTYLSLCCLMLDHHFVPAEIQIPSVIRFLLLPLEYHHQLMTAFDTLMFWYGKISFFHPSEAWRPSKAVRLHLIGGGLSIFSVSTSSEASFSASSVRNIQRLVTFRHDYIFIWMKQERKICDEILLLFSVVVRFRLRLRATRLWICSQPKLYVPTFILVSLILFHFNNRI